MFKPLEKAWIKLYSKHVQFSYTLYKRNGTFSFVVDNNDISSDLQNSESLMIKCYLRLVVS